MKLLQKIVIVSDIPVLVTVICAAVLYRQFSKPLKVFSWFVFLSGFIQFASLLLFIAGKNNMPLLHVYVASGFACLIWFYATVLQNLVSVKIMWGIAALFLVFTIINSVFIQGIFRFNSNALVVESILIIILALSTFIFFLNDTVKETGMRDIQSLNWINSGLFIYYLSCLLIFYFGDTILFRFSRHLSTITWLFHTFFSVVMYTCFFVGLWKRSKTQNL